MTNFPINIILLLTNRINPIVPEDGVLLVYKFYLFSIIAVFSLWPNIHAMDQEGATNNPYHESLRNTCKQLIEKNDVNYAQYGVSMLMQVTEEGLIDCMRMLIEAGADVNFVQIRGQDKTVLHCVAQKGNLEATRLLIENKATIDPIYWSSYEGKLTPLMLAAEYGHQNCVRELIAAGANLNYADDHYVTNGNTALLMARENCIPLLVDAGADIFHANQVGVSALSKAIYSCNQQLSEYLIERILNQPKEKISKFLSACKNSHSPAHYAQIRNLFRQLFPTLIRENKARVFAIINGIYEDPRFPGITSLKSRLLKKYFNQ